jgi:hypothetical protein
MPATTARARAEPAAPEVLSFGQLIDGWGRVGAIVGEPCLAADGRVVATVRNGAQESALACGDARGFTPIVRAGDPSPRGGEFFEFPDCALPANGAVYFIAGRSDPTAWEGRTRDLYRATPDGIEWVAGPGTIATDGTALRRLDTVDDPNVPGASMFDVNDRGTVLLRAVTAAGPVFMRVRRDGSTERLRHTGDGVQWVTGGPALAGDDTVLGSANQSNSPVIVALEPSGVRVLFTLADVGDFPGISHSFSTFIARGDRFGLNVFRYDNILLFRGMRQYLLHTPENGFAPLIDPGIYDDVLAIDLTPAGRALIAGRFWDERHDVISSSPTEYAVVDEHGLTVVGRQTFPDKVYTLPYALALNDRGNVLVQKATESTTPGRQSLGLIGPSPDRDVHCFVPPTVAVPTSTPAPTEIPTHTSTPSATPTPTIDCSTEACAHLRVGTASGAPGQRVTVVVTLDSGPWTIAGLQADLPMLHSAPIVRGASGEPACRLDPAIDKPDTSFTLYPAGCTDACTHVRAIVVSLSNLEPLPSHATIYECDLLIAADADPGPQSLAPSTVLAADPLARLVPIEASPGTIDVQRSAGRPVSGSLRTTAGDGGCQTTRSDATAVWLALPALLLLRRRSPL